MAGREISQIKTHDRVRMRRAYVRRSEQRGVHRRDAGCIVSSPVVDRMRAFSPRITRYGLSVWSGGFLLLLLLQTVLAGSAAGQVNVIAHPSVPVDSLERNRLLRLFSGDEEYWDNELQVVIMDLSVQGDIRDAFYSFLGKTSSRMRSIWLKRKLTGEGELPESIDSEEELASKVANTEEAIGFVSASTADSLSDVKILIRDIPIP